MVKQVTGQGRGGSGGPQAGGKGAPSRGRGAHGAGGGVPGTKWRISLVQSAKLVSPKRRCRRREASMRTRAVTSQASALNRVRRALKTMDPGRGRVRQSSSPKYPWPAVQVTPDAANNNEADASRLRRSSGSRKRVQPCRSLAWPDTATASGCCTGRSPKTGRRCGV